MGKKTSLGVCVVYVKHLQTLQTNFVSIPSPSLAFQTLAQMMVLVLNIRNLRERNTLMALVIIRHKELERQKTNMMAMVIINFKKHERMTIHTIYECE